MARSSSGLGRRPLKAEITGSTPVRATKREIFCFPFLFKGENAYAKIRKTYFHL